VCSPSAEFEHNEHDVICINVNAFPIIPRVDLSVQQSDNLNTLLCCLSKYSFPRWQQFVLCF
jgi:hypothetical protein